MATMKAALSLFTPTDKTHPAKGDVMTAQHKTDKAERLAAFAAALAKWQALDSRSELGSSMLRFTRHNNTPVQHKETP